MEDEGEEDFKISKSSRRVLRETGGGMKEPRVLRSRRH